MPGLKTRPTQWVSRRPIAVGRTLRSGDLFHGVRRRYLPARLVELDPQRDQRAHALHQGQLEELLVREARLGAVLFVDHGLVEAFGSRHQCAPPAIDGWISLSTISSAALFASSLSFSDS